MRGYRTCARTSGISSTARARPTPASRASECIAVLSAAKVVELLIEKKGYTDRELPSNETIRNILNAEGYTLRKVQKTKPKERSPRLTPSSSRSIG